MAVWERGAKCMPKIEAENIEQHIRRQTNRILDAAVELFSERGYRSTDMNDIAGRIGLARNSLYRYYANKDHILLACVQRDMAPFLQQVRDLESSLPEPRARIDAWIDLQMQIATGPCRATMEMIGEIREASPNFRREIRALHEPPARVLEAAIAELVGGTDRDAKLLAAMTHSMVQSAAAQAIARGELAEICSELKRAIARILEE